VSTGRAGNSSEIGEKVVEQVAARLGGGKGERAHPGDGHLVDRSARRIDPGLAPNRQAEVAAPGMFPPDPVLLPFSPPVPLRHRIALRLLWRIVLRSGGSRALQNQGCGVVAVPRPKRNPARSEPRCGPFLTPPTESEIG
jgi:hypothetical protein